MPNKLISAIIKAINEIKGEQLIVLDFKNIENAFSDYFIICEGSSNIHVSAISTKIQKHVSKTIKEKPNHIEGDQISEWILLDYIDVVVHIFQKSTRIFYNIEELWADTKQIEINTFLDS